MNASEKLAGELKEMFPGFTFEVEGTEDEVLPPYCIKMFKGKQEVKHVHASEPNKFYIAEKLK